MTAVDEIAHTPRQSAEVTDPRSTLHRTVGVVVSDVTNPFYPELLDVLQTELGFLGFHALLFNQRSSNMMTPVLRDQVEHHLVGGLIVTSATTSWKLPPAIASRQVPAVLLNRLIDGADLDAITADNVAGGRLAAQFLMDLDHTRIGIIAGPKDISTHRDRHDGFMQTVAESPGVVAYEAPAAITDYSHAIGQQAAKLMLQSNPEVTALFCTNDLMAIGAMSAARQLGLQVPQDISILGFDNIEMSHWDVISLSTINHPFREMAKLASQRIADLMSDTANPAPRQIQLPVQVISRDSTSHARKEAR